MVCCTAQSQFFGIFGGAASLHIGLSAYYNHLRLSAYNNHLCLSDYNNHLRLFQLASGEVSLTILTSNIVGEYRRVFHNYPVPKNEQCHTQTV